MSVRLYDTRIAGRLRINGRSNGNTRYARLNVRRELGVEVNELRLNLFVKTIQAERQRPLLITEDGIRLDDMDKTARRDEILDPFLEVGHADGFRPTGQRLWQEELNRGNLPEKINPRNTHATSTIASDGDGSMTWCNFTNTRYGPLSGWRDPMPAPPQPGPPIQHCIDILRTRG